MKAILTILLSGALSLPALVAHAADSQYPSRPIRFMVPFPAGGPTDVIARLMAQKLTEAWGQQVVVDNRAGAGGNIGMGIAANSAPDGYTVLFVSSAYFVNPGLYKQVSYDPYKSFIPISNIAASPHAFFAHPSQPVKTLPDLIDVVRKDPRKYSMATPGIGTTPDLNAHLLRLEAKLDIVLVPYAGGAPSMAAVLANQVPFGCQAIPPLMPHIKGGRLRPLALTAEKRSPALPDVPTMAEAGFKGHEAETIQGFLVPAGTSNAIVTRLHSEAMRIVALPDVKSRILDLGFDIVASSPQEFAAQVKREVPKWAKVVKDANIQVQ